MLSVEVQILERQPPIASISVKGTARTGGWKNVELKPLQTFAPEVGMRSYTLVGTPPNLAYRGALNDLFPRAPFPSFLQWMMVGAPLAAVFIALGYFALRILAD